MDASSLSASVPSMLSMIDVLRANEQLCTELKTSTEPSRELRGLQAELSELENVFQTIQEPLFVVPDLSPIELDAVSKALVKIAGLLSFLNFKVTVAGIDVGGDHWQWIRKKSNIEGLRKQLISTRCGLITLVIPQSSHAFEPRRSIIHSLSHGSWNTAPRVPGVIRSIRPCYVLIFLGLLTILGSLVPAVWRSISHNDISGGFSLAQYILGVGVFVIGCVVAIHSRTCNCWSSDSRAISPNYRSSMELEAVNNISNVQPHESPR